jgi:hypothetical protein
MVAAKSCVDALWLLDEQKGKLMDRILLLQPTQSSVTGKKHLHENAMKKNPQAPAEERGTSRAETMNTERYQLQRTRRSTKEI